ncbi:hypothetical protein CEP53_008637 [Fusarium sp. AF-6]|nr:hypothetical protein CEP53_008637 [Fusarium sp. AF-6]
MTTKRERYGSGPVNASPLAQPLHFEPSGRTAKNRFLKSPMAEALATFDPDIPSKRGIPTNEIVELYRRWGQGKNNWGVIVTGNIDIDYEAIAELSDMIITDNDPFEGKRFDQFRALATAAKADGSLILGQVSHPGRQVSARFQTHAISASAVPLTKYAEAFAIPYAASKEEISRIVEGFAYAAEYLYKAGFDGIELHAAHGFLLSQFLSRTTNKRTDEYGVQTLGDRLRLISEIVQAIKVRVPSTFMVAAKLNSVEFQEGGVTPEDSKELCRKLEELGLDFVELSGETFENFGPDGVTLARPAAAEPRLPTNIIEGGVTGAIRPFASVEGNFGLSHSIARTQMSQIAKGKEPLGHHGSDVVERYTRDWEHWAEKTPGGAGMTEGSITVNFSGPKTSYGVVEE